MIFLKEILNIQYQSGGYSIFNIENPISNITLTSVWYADGPSYELRNAGIIIIKRRRKNDGRSLMLVGQINDLKYDFKL